MSSGSPADRVPKPELKCSVLGTKQEGAHTLRLENCQMNLTNSSLKMGRYREGLNHSFKDQHFIFKAWVHGT